jgi:hypothetical protein
VHRVLRLKGLHWHKLLRSLMLPLLLLVAQQGAVLHELSHYTAAETHDGKKQSPRGDVCDLGLAFAQVGSAATPHDVVPPLLADLSHQLTPVFPVYAGAVQLPAERSRGPPLFL